MSMVDKLKDAAEQVIDEHGETVKQAIDRAEDFADEMTGGRYSDKIHAAAAKSEDVVDSNAEPEPAGPLPPSDPGH